MNARLAKLERQVRQLSGVGGTCMACCGDPFAILLKDRPDEGPRLQPACAERLTPELRCRACGRAARQVLLVTAVSASLRDDRMPPSPRIPRPHLKARRSPGTNNRMGPQGERTGGIRHPRARP